jgi:ATP-dependent 26S proteasome regulatory subunit
MPINKTNTETLFKDCTLKQFIDALIRGNGFGHETLWIKTFFGELPFGITERTIGQYEHNICQYVMQDYFETQLGYNKIKESYFDEGGEVAITYENLEYDNKKFKKVYKNAFVMYENASGEKICVSINVFSSREIIYRIYANPTLDNILIDWFALARKHNLYRGKKIDADCKFLQLADVTWDDIILQPKVVKIIKDNVTESFENIEILRANGLSLKTGLIFAGPPGTGKTMLAKVISKGISGTVIYALPSHLERSSEISRVCDMAKDLAPCILIIEDIDWIAESRDESYNAGAVIQLMNQLDGLQEFADVLTIATTNNVDKIEDAVKNRPGRFDRVINVPKPDADCRMRMFKTFTKNFNLADVDFEEIVKSTKGLSGAHVKDIVRTAARMAIRAKSFGDDKIAIVKQEHFESALKEVSNVDYSSYHKTQNKVKKMGFGTFEDDIF